MPQRAGLGLPCVRRTRGVRVSSPLAPPSCNTGVIGDDSRSAAPVSKRRSRGVRLSDLDRSQVYRIAFVGRRWEVLAPEDAPDEGAGPVAGGAGGARDALPSTPAPYAPRHATTAVS